jgi:hypothetical protein
MSATEPFRQWLAAGCPDEFDYEGMPVDADWVISVEYEAVYEAGPSILESHECEGLGLPDNSTNEEAIRELRKRWPLDPARPANA